MTITELVDRFDDGVNALQRIADALEERNRLLLEVSERRSEEISKLFTLQEKLVEHGD
jgi:hypothetical protein